MLQVSAHLITGEVLVAERDPGPAPSWTYVSGPLTAAYDLVCHNAAVCLPSPTSASALSGRTSPVLTKVGSQGPARRTRWLKRRSARCAHACDQVTVSVKPCHVTYTRIHPLETRRQVSSSRVDTKCTPRIPYPSQTAGAAPHAPVSPLHAHSAARPSASPAPPTCHCTAPRPTTSLSAHPHRSNGAEGVCSASSQQWHSSRMPCGDSTPSSVWGRQDVGHLIACYRKVVGTHWAR